MEDELEEDGIWKQRYEDVWRSRKILEVENSQLKNNLDYFERQIKILVEEKNALLENKDHRTEQLLQHNDALIQTINGLELKMTQETETLSNQLRDKDSLIVQKVDNQDI